MWHLTQKWFLCGLTELSTTSNRIDRRHIIFGFINRVMIITAIICVICLFIAPYFIKTHIPPQDLLKLLMFGFILIGFHSALLWINQRHCNLAVLLFIVVFNGLLLNGDSTYQLIEGRSCIYFIIPTIIVSLLYPPFGGIIYAILTIILLSILSIYSNGSPNIPGSWAYIFTAVIVSYSAYILESSLQNIKLINQNLSDAQSKILSHNIELEQKISERTRDLEKVNADLAMSLLREKEFSTKDYLTGIYNRRVFFEIFQKEFAIAKRYQADFCIVLFDIDHFKQINDHYGHHIGDAAIKHIVNITKNELRTSDVFGRYGGEEFVILLPHTTLESSVHISERIREKIAGTPYVTDKLYLNITISIGVSSQPFSFQNFEKMIERADHMMYKAKTSGRNQVCV